jgi:hypothetical protein
MYIPRHVLHLHVLPYPLFWTHSPDPLVVFRSEGPTSPVSWVPQIDSTPTLYEGWGAAGKGEGCASGQQSWAWARALEEPLPVRVSPGEAALPGHPRQGSLLLLQS